MEVILLENKKSIQYLLKLYPNFKDLLGIDTKEEFLENRTKTSNSGCPARFGFDSSYRNGRINCINDCPRCWKNLLKEYEW